MNLWRGPYAPLLRWPLAATTVTGLLAMLIGGFFAGLAGGVGALLGAIVTVAVFAISLLVMAGTMRVSPPAVMGVALLTYVLKVWLLGVLLVVLHDAAWLSGSALAGAVIGCVTVWLIAQLVASRRAQVPVFDSGGRRGDSHAARTKHD